MPSEISYKDIFLYKTENCRNWEEQGFCRYGKRCRYAHGKEELRPISRSNQYKTKTCKAYHEGGTCPYGIRCTFIHHPNDKPATPNEDSLSSRILPVATTAAKQKLHPPNNPVAYSPSSIYGNIWDSKLGLSHDYTSLHLQQPMSSAQGVAPKPTYDGLHYYNTDFNRASFH